MLKYATLLFLLGCGPEEVPSTPEVNAPEAPPGTQHGERTDFAQAFEPRTVRIGGEDRALTTHGLGQIVVAGESLSSIHVGTEAALEALRVRIPTGSYEVQASVLDGDTPLVAALRVVLKVGVAATYTYVGSFATEGHAVLCGDTVAETIRAGGGRDIMVKVQAGTEHWFTHSLVEEQPDTAICASGFGEGTYDAYVGRDDQGHPVSVVLDFGVLVEPVEASHDFGDLLALGEGPIEVPGLTDRGVKIARQHGEVDLALDSASVSADPTIGGFEVLWFDANGEQMYGREQAYGSKMSFSAPRGGGCTRVVLRWVASIRPL